MLDHDLHRPLYQTKTQTNYRSRWALNTAKLWQPDIILELYTKKISIESVFNLARLYYLWLKGTIITEIIVGSARSTECFILPFSQSDGDFFLKYPLFSV